MSNRAIMPPLDMERLTPSLDGEGMLIEWNYIDDDYAQLIIATTTLAVNVVGGHTTTDTGGASSHDYTSISVVLPVYGKRFMFFKVLHDKGPERKNVWQVHIDRYNKLREYIADE